MKYWGILFLLCNYSLEGWQYGNHLMVIRSQENFVLYLKTGCMGKFGMTSAICSVRETRDPEALGQYNHWKCALKPHLKVIPLKLFYYQTFFETWRNEHSWYEHYKNAIKKWGHHACLPVSRLLKWGYFYWLYVKSLNHLHTELILVTWKAQSLSWK